MPSEDRSELMYGVRINKILFIEKKEQSAHWTRNKHAYQAGAKAFGKQQ